MEKKERKQQWRILLLLNLLLMVYSLSGVCSKYAAGEEFLSLPFLLLYGGVLALLAIYALFWQQIIKRLPLTLAYANKAVSLIWGMLWGVIFFHEGVSAGKIAGAVMIIAGIVLYAFSDVEADRKEGKEGA